MRILGLDVSSTTTGYSILEIDAYNNVKLLIHDHIKPMKKEDGELIERLNEISNDIKKICDKYKPNYIGIEEITEYMPGKSSANTIITLAVFNRAVGLQCYKSTGILPLFTSPMGIRKAISNTFKFKRLDKEEMPSVVHYLFGADNFTYAVKKMGKNKGEASIETFDQADAVAVSLHYLIELKKHNKLCPDVCSCKLCVKYDLYNLIEVPKPKKSKKPRKKKTKKKK